MAVKLALQNLADWIGDAADAAKGSVDLTLESGLLKDSLDDLCDVGGVAGALFKLGSRAIPDPTPEQRIAAGLHRVFLTALDKELKERAELIPKRSWKKFVRTRLVEVTGSKLSARFTWLSIFSGSGQRPSRSWPIVGELADVARAWIAGAAALAGKPEPEVQRSADDVRGRIHEALCREVDRLVQEPAVARAVAEAQPRVAREALDLLAEQLTTFKRYRLFGEIPQESLYVPARIKVADLRDLKENLDWSKVEPRELGDEILFEQLRQSHPRLVVIEGDMGAGKSCLLRLLASRLAEQYLADRRHAPVYVRWRDVFDQPELGKAIAERLAAEHGLPFDDLATEKDVVYLIDGFDEMSSHQEGYVSQCFERLARLAGKSCSVVVTMRSTVVTPGLRLAWRNHAALAIDIQEFSAADVDSWAAKWCSETGAQGVTGNRLRSLCDESSQEPGAGLSRNPLLLYMLAKYVEPVAQGRTGRFRRTEIFRTFVDETIRGKLRASGEELFPLDEMRYRMLLQEIAYLASWPKHAPKCPAWLLQERAGSVLKELNFDDVRTAFVLHFFEPGGTAGEFEFQPEGFRQYLLAEWCVRAQFDALRDERPAALSRSRAQAMNALAQIPSRMEESILINEIYEEIGRLAIEKGEELARRLLSFGLEVTAVSRSDQLQLLYRRVQREAEEPPAQNWEDHRVGLPEGQDIPPGLNESRVLLNYWHQCLLAAFGLYRGLKIEPKSQPLFLQAPEALSRFLRLQAAIREPPLSWRIIHDRVLGPLKLLQMDLGLDLSHLGLAGIDLRRANLGGVNLGGSDLSGANLFMADLSESELQGANLEGAKLIGVELVHANLKGANLSGAQLSGADLRRANLSGSDLGGARLFGADLRSANLKDAVLKDADLRYALLGGAEVNPNFLEEASGSPALMPDGSVPERRNEDF